MPTWEPAGATGALETLRDWLRMRGIDGELRAKDGAVLSMSATVRGNRHGSKTLPLEGRRLIFNSHIDTVPPSDVERWRYPYLSPTEVDGRLYGLGACDAKGCVAAMAAAFVLLAESWRGPSDLELMIVDGEERGGLGTRMEVERGMEGSVIVGEPTSLVPMIAAKGTLRAHITAHGKPAHSSQPDAGVNAIYPIAALVHELEALAPEVALQTERWTGHASLAVTTIAGGTAPNVIPARCTIHVDRRLVPGEQARDAQAQIEEAVERVQQKYPDAEIRVEVLRILEAPVTPEDAPIVEITRAVGKSIRDDLVPSGSERQETSGPTPDIAGFTACCDLSFIVHDAGLPGVIWGPGSLDQAHQVNEHLPLSEFERSVEAYRLAGLEWQQRWCDA